MGEIMAGPCLTQEGVAFTVAVGVVQRECIVSVDALAHLRQTHGFSMELHHIYRAFEARIISVARRLVIAGEHASPLVLGPQYFH